MLCSLIVNMNFMLKENRNRPTGLFLVGRFLFVMKLFSATIVLQIAVKALILHYFNDPPGSRTRISRTGILRAIHYTSGS